MRTWQQRPENRDRIVGKDCITLLDSPTLKFHFMNVFFLPIFCATKFCLLQAGAPTPICGFSFLPAPLRSRERIRSYPIPDISAMHFTADLFARDALWWHSRKLLLGLTCKFCAFSSFFAHDNFVTDSSFSRKFLKLKWERLYAHLLFWDENRTWRLLKDMRRK